MIDKLAAAQRQIAADSAIQKRFQIAGARVIASTPEEAADRAARERPMWRETIQISGAKAE